MSVPGFTAQACLYPSPTYRHVGIEGGGGSLVAASTGCADEIADLTCAHICFPDTYDCDGDKCVCHTYGWQPPPPPPRQPAPSPTTDWYTNEALRIARFGR